MKSLLIIAALLLSTATYAEDCPKGVKDCKVLVLTPEEINTLTQPGGIFDLAVWANRANMEGLVTAWKNKLQMAPQGTVKADEPKQ